MTRTSRLHLTCLAALGVLLGAACAPNAARQAAPAPAAAPLAAPAPVPDRLEAIQAGERVAVAYRGRRMRGVTVKGRVLAADSAGVRIAEESGEPRYVAREDMEKLWVSRGSKSRSSAAGRGLLIGALAGGVIGYASGDDCDASTSPLICFDRSDTGLLGGALFGVGGLLLGALLGGGEQWKSVPVERRQATLHLTPEPSSRGVSLVRLEF